MKIPRDKTIPVLDLRDWAKPVYHGKESTYLSIYGTSPENPSGTALCLMRYPRIAQGGHSGPVVQASVCIKDLESGHVRELSSAEVTNHNGANAFWVDNHLLAYQKRYLNTFEVFDTRSGRPIYKVRGELGHRCTTGGIPYTVSNHRLSWYDPDAEAVAHEDEGLFMLDPNTGEHNQIISLPEILEAIRDRHPRLSTHKVHILHLDPSPSGDRYLFDYRAESVSGQTGGKHQGYVNADGTDCRILSVRCGHTVWFDNDSYCGPVNGLTGRFDLDGNRVEILGGTSLHIGTTPDGMWYGGDRVDREETQDGKTRVFIFKRGRMEPVALVGESGFSQVTWSWVAHPNPAFSDDGKRFYFTQATGAERFEACSFDMGALISD